MSKTRMTKTLCWTIAKEISQNGVQERLDLAKELKKAAAHEIYVAVLGEELIGQLKALPVEFSTTQPSIKVGVLKVGDAGSERVPYEDGYGNRYHFELDVVFDEYLVCVSDRHRNRVMSVMNQDNPLIKEYQYWKKEIEELNSKRCVGEGRLYNALLGFKTVEAAMEFCPDIGDELSKFLKEPPCTPNLPAVIGEEMSAILLELAA